MGSPAQVKEEVHRTLQACGSSQGGIIACGEVGPDVPLENIRAMYEAFREYGTYAASAPQPATSEVQLGNSGIETC
jgi:uroporphyrinogen-III decarboxylase